MKHAFRYWESESFQNVTSASCRTVGFHRLSTNFLSLHTCVTTLTSNPGGLFPWFTFKHLVLCRLRIWFMSPVPFMFTSAFSTSQSCKHVWGRAWKVASSKQLYIPSGPLKVGSYSSSFSTLSDWCRRWRCLDVDWSASHTWTTASRWRLQYCVAKGLEMGDSRMKEERASCTTLAVRLPPLPECCRCIPTMIFDKCIFCLHLLFLSEVWITFIGLYWGSLMYLLNRFCTEILMVFVDFVI